jgi:hypothetical protein
MVEITDTVCEYQLVTYIFLLSGLNIIPVAPEPPVGIVVIMLLVESSIAETELVELGSEL